MLLIVLIAFGWHSLSMWFTADIHPIRWLAEAVGVLLIYHLARKLIDQIGKEKAP